MIQYCRSRVAGSTFFFTVNLRNPRCALLIAHIDALRNMVRGVKANLPFTTDSKVVLAGDWHAVWTLPSVEFACS
jgi:putative transposase